MPGLIQVDLVQERETKNMVLFVADKDPDVARKGNIPNIYIRKTVLATAFSKFPEQIRVTVEVK